MRRRPQPPRNREGAAVPSLLISPASHGARSCHRQDAWALAHLVVSLLFVVPFPWWDFRAAAPYWATVAFLAAAVLLGRDLLPSRRSSLMPDFARVLPWLAALALELHAISPILAGARPFPAPLYLLAAWLLPGRQAAAISTVVAAWTTLFHGGHLSHAAAGTAIDALIFLPAGILLRKWIPYPQGFLRVPARRKGGAGGSTGADSAESAGGSRPAREKDSFPTDRLDSLRKLADPSEGIRRVLEGVLPACGAELVFFARANPFRLVLCEPQDGALAADAGFPDALRAPCEEAYFTRRPVRSGGNRPADGNPTTRLGDRIPGEIAVVPVATGAGIVGMMGAIRFTEGSWEEPVVPMLEQGAFFVGREIEVKDRLDGVYWEVARADGIYRQVRQIAEVADRSRDGGGEELDRREDLYRITAEGVRDHLDARRVLMIQVDSAGKKGRISCEAREGDLPFEKLEEWEPLDDSFVEWIVRKGKARLVKSGSGIPVLPAAWREAEDGAALLLPVGLPDGFQGVMACLSRLGEGEVFDEERDLSRGEQFLNVMRMGVSHAAEVERLASEAHRDGLTGLLNRKTFCTRLDRVLERLDLRRPCAVIMLDVDHFKRINDRYGHPAGDEVIRTVAGVIDRTVRKVDLAGRYGGEEFVVYLDGTDESQALQAAERLRILIRNTKYTFAGKEVTVTASMGIACYPVHGTRGDELLRFADEALYRSKAGGRDRATLFGSAT